MKTRCLIVDDEPLAIEAIRIHIEKLESLKLVAESTDAIQAFDTLRNNRIDLMFLDIQMPEMSGLDFLHALKNPPKVIFTTAYREYAIQAFDLDVIDYLLKPISFDRFMQAVNKYFESVPQDIITGDPADPKKEDYFYIKAEKKNVKVRFDEIMYIESIKDYVKIVCKSKTIISKIMIGELIRQLPESLFLRIHRSYIVYTPNVEAFSSISVEVPGKEIPIGRNYKNETLKTLHSGFH
jgi:DNA-binding LytR/AlgR family response regulator